MGLTSGQTDSFWVGSAYQAARERTLVSTSLQVVWELYLGQDEHHTRAHTHTWKGYAALVFMCHLPYCTSTERYCNDTFLTDSTAVWVPIWTSHSGTGF